MKVGDTVQLHSHGWPTFHYAEIVGEKIQEHETELYAGEEVWVVDCPSKGFRGVVFGKEGEDGKHYN